MTRASAIAAVAVLLVGLGAATVFALRGDDDRFASCRAGAIAGGQAQIGGPFALVDGTGAPATSEDVITRPTLVYFGYTFCPDFCPTDLARNALAADLLAEQGVDVGQVFISVDPARDTPEVVGDYAAAMHPDLVGLTGSPEAVAEAATAYRAYYNRADGGDDEFYLVDHSTFTYLMAPGEGFLEFYRSQDPAQNIAESVACFAERL